MCQWPSRSGARFISFSMEVPHADGATGEESTHVAMEATGVYWKPVWQVLADSSFELILANAVQVKNVPGRKTDVNDATWLSELLAHGLVRASFVPQPAIQELRGLLRTRKQLVREKAGHVQRVQKTLEEANIKIESVLSDVMGHSGRAIIQALIDGETDPAKLATLAHWKVRALAATLREALRGRIKRHHRFLLQLHMQQINALETGIAALEREVDAGLACFRDAVERLSTIPGISQLSAQVVVSEIGTDMSRFATDAHLRSSARLCRRNDESAGKRRSTRLRKGAPWLKTMLVVLGPPRVAKALPSITCLRTVHSITISALPTSIAAVRKRKHAASSNVWPSLAFPSNSSLWQPSHDPPVSL